MSDESETSTVSEAPSTPAPAASEAPAPSPPTSDLPSETSGAKESLLDAVLKVVPASNETDVLADKSAEASTETPTDKPDDGTAEAAPEEDDDGEPPVDAGNTRLRKQISRLLKQRHELRENVTQLEALRMPAEIGEQMQAFAEVNDLSGEDVARVMQLAAMMRQGDYAGFYKAVAPFVRTAQEYLGIALPRDLRERVQSGHMSEAAAKEFARTRMDEHRGRIEVQQRDQTMASRQLQDTQNQVANSVSSFERQIAANDPDYKAKAESVRRTAQAMLLERGGKISNVREALEITKAAYDEVNANMRKLRPAPAATSRTPNGNGQTMSATAEPKSLMEAAMQGLARARNGAGHP